MRMAQIKLRFGGKRDLFVEKVLDVSLHLSQIFDSTDLSCEVNLAENVLQRSKDLFWLFNFSLDVASKEVFAYFKIVCVKLVSHIPTDRTVLPSSIKYCV